MGDRVCTWPHCNENWLGVDFNCLLPQPGEAPKPLGSKLGRNHLPPPSPRLFCVVGSTLWLSLPDWALACLPLTCELHWGLGDSQEPGCLQWTSDCDMEPVLYVSVTADSRMANVMPIFLKKDPEAISIIPCGEVCLQYQGYWLK